MVYLPPPQLTNGARPSYGEAYANIIAAYRSSPLTSASSVLVLVAPDVDALCAARMLSNLFNQDDVIHRIIPISGFTELEALRDQLLSYSELHTLILLNMGGILDLPSPTEWFGDFSTKLTVHVIDSLRPLNLSSLFMGGENGERIVIWDDGGAENLQEERKSWEALMYEPLPDSDEEDSEYERDGSDGDNSGEAYENESDRPGKRRPLSDGDDNSNKRRRIDHLPQHRMSHEEYIEHNNRIEKYYLGGSHHGQSASGTIYLLATVLERVDNDLLWFAILGLTYQYTTSRISRESYETYHAIYHDEVSRLNPLPSHGGDPQFISLAPDDTSVRATNELRFMLFRHWTLYDAMYHSSYVASKLGIWKERGRKRLTGLLAKMGFSIPQTQQPYAHMDMDLKKVLLDKLNDVAPEYGLVELLYPSFMRFYGYRSQPLSAADAVEGIRALLDVASGVRIEVEVEGARNGGEWFGGGRVWEANVSREIAQRGAGEGKNPPRRPEVEGTKNTKKTAEGGIDGQPEAQKWWVKNFWSGFDALNDIDPLREALNLAMSLHRAVIRQGTSIIDKQDIRTMKDHRVVVLTQGPDLALFAHPSILSRLALWLVDALRDRIPGTNVSIMTKRKSLPFVVACLNESEGTYTIVGVMAALNFGDVRKNEFSYTFLAAKNQCNAIVRHNSFDATVLEINQKDLKNFLGTLCEGPDKGVE